MDELEKLRELAIAYKNFKARYDMLSALNTSADYNERFRNTVERNMAQEATTLAQSRLLNFIRHEFMENKSE